MIKMLVTDVDGVLTDGNLHLGPSGEYKVFNVKDGMGANLLKSNGLILAAISGRKSVYSEQRLKEMGFDHIFLGVKDKLSVFKELKSQMVLSFEEISFIGDDLNDLDCLNQSGLSFAPKGAASQVLNTVDYVTENTGGEGCFREVCEYILSKEKINFNESFKSGN